MEVMDYFKQICSIPHCSFETQKMSEFLVDFCNKNGCKTVMDEFGTIHAIKGKPKLCLQAHYDMVCIGEAPNLELVVDNGYMMAKNSSLGADNGIGVAIMMNAISNFENIECLFTNDEEVGMIGATNFKGEIVSKYLLNLDSEDDNEVIVGCAGGLDLFASIDSKMQITSIKNTYEVTVSRLCGGHSGIEIHKNISNAIKVLTRFLKENDCKLVSIDGGERSNSIPTKAKAVVVSEKELVSNNEFISVKKIDSSKEVMANGDIVLAFINSFSQGVRSYDANINIVLNSINLSLVNIKDGKVVLTFFARSMDEKGLRELEFETTELAKVLGFDVVVKDRSVAWKPEITDFANDILKQLQVFRPEAKITAIHAGLECGILKDGQKNLTVCSIGPNIHSPHSTNEKVELASVEIITKVVNNIVRKYQ
ncbi:aminoacyl-histidine dipeptidase [Campylobacter pinnipediorum subsp. caledonicus]|uniref:Aminoacyl-histidine dipeptidase n=1 Tax=Campylobacter pinnipediorum subsp. caledonicus TaxID=1874362 RepID=A0A1S6U7H9_9BACT|nr:M20/M25/M40 family metallo-hydrolase [Campylobacter pinnipediorum]AQW86025.1 aminoacyl-histidine dipeptidase [Campylobacter pinnipediorum subsp. caledonicus]AQW87632.1 aminoacyl-histidine dipeptidase [Campylobacter pinnipediorum subsp. caledonicus]OPA72236.1 aminoacyl-histidine dipeptidase [Campylobacter pinnipediorum subsp. caledonicus]